MGVQHASKIPMEQPNALHAALDIFGIQQPSLVRLVTLHVQHVQQASLELVLLAPHPRF